MRAEHHPRARSPRRRRPRTAALACAVLGLSALEAHAHGIPPRLATVMTEIGARFASLGGAIAARDDDLARYQVRQIAELLERDLVLATPPRPLYGMDLEPLRTSFRDGPWRALQNAVDNHDFAAADAAFGAAAAACNDCHRTTGVPFLAVPGLPPPPTAAKGRKPGPRRPAQPAASAPATTKSKVESTPAR